MLEFKATCYTKTDLVFGFTGNQILVKVSPDKRRRGLSPDTKRRGLYSLNFISDFIRKPLQDEYNVIYEENYG